MAAIVGVEPWAGDPAPSHMLAAIPDLMDPQVRIDRPYVREGWLAARTTRPPEPRAAGASSDYRRGRGSERFVPVDWDTVLDLAAGEIRRVIDTHGNDAVFAGSYGWTSAGRLHHAQSVVKRFFNLLGGYTAHVDTYSVGAGHPAPSGLPAAGGQAGAADVFSGSLLPILRVGTHPGNGLVLHDEAVSRIHFEILAQDDGFRSETWDRPTAPSSTATESTTPTSARPPGSGPGRPQSTLSSRTKRASNPSRSVAAWVSWSVGADPCGRCSCSWSRSRAPMHNPDSRRERHRQRADRRGDPPGEYASEQCPFVVFDCSAVPANLMESELFGHERGVHRG